MATFGDRDRLRALLDAGIVLSSELSLETVLQRTVETAAALTGARYAALGVIDESHHDLERFVQAGIDAETYAAIGELPRGRGILGLVIEEARPLRLHDLSEHPASSGFPPHHPQMRSFLGVPVLIRGVAWGGAEPARPGCTLQRCRPADRGDLRRACSRRLRSLGACQPGHDEPRDRGPGARAPAARTRAARRDRPGTDQHPARVEGDPERCRRRERGAGGAGGTYARRAGTPGRASPRRRVRPTALDDFGLVPALERLAEATRERAGLDVHVHASLPERRLPSEVETALYRLVQEALTNVLKHAQANAVSILLSLQDGAVQVMVEDDGRGFTPGESRDGALGLLGMQERLSLLGGEVTIESTPGAGTTVRALLPLSES